MSKLPKEKPYVIVRSYAMGVFAGYLEPESTETMKLLSNARRFWRWEGAQTISQLAVDGPQKPKDCKFPAEVPLIELTSPQGFEVCYVTEAAKKQIAKVPIWKV